MIDRLFLRGERKRNTFNLQETANTGKQKSLAASQLQMGVKILAGFCANKQPPCLKWEGRDLCLLYKHTTYAKTWTREKYSHLTTKVGESAICCLFEIKCIILFLSLPIYQNNNCLFSLFSSQA